MAEVTFPTRLGGNGQTISDDADPNTGLLNGGHRTRFVPALQGTVQMADYVFQYADKIDNAASDANRAENARGYVESVADAYKVNIRDAYRNKWTLSLDFERGRYGVDDGELVETTDASEILTVERASTKWVVGPNGKLREVPPDTLAREWKDGKCQGALIEESRTNLLRWSEDFTQGVWVNPGRTEVSKESDPAGVFGREVSVIEAVETGRVYVSQDTPMSESAVTFSAYVLFDSPDQEVYIRATGVAGTNPFMTFTGWDGTNLSVSVDSGIGNAGYEPLSGGWVRVWASYEVSGDRSDQFRFGILSDELGEKLYCTGAQLEEASIPSSYIPTEDAPVTRPADRVFRSMDGDFNPSQGTVVFSGKYLGMGSGGLMLFGQGNERIGIYPESNGYIFGSRNATGDAPRSGIQLDVGDSIKAAFTYSANQSVDVKFVANGQVVRSDSELDISLTGLLDFRGRLAGSGFDNLPAHLQSSSVEYIPYALTESEMIELTASGGAE